MEHVLKITLKLNEKLAGDNADFMMLGANLDKLLKQLGGFESAVIEPLKD